MQTLFDFSDFQAAARALVQKLQYLQIKLVDAAAPVVDVHGLSSIKIKNPTRLLP
jgi:hypothetical protein